MRHLGTATAAALLLALGSAPVLVPQVADAATPSCRGQDATIVGVAGKPVTGTDGPDVIVSNGATSVDGGGGDDVICLTGTVGSTSFKVFDDAGDGDDRIYDDMAYDGPADDATFHVSVFLGDGENTFEGGSAPELVAASGDAVDHISTGGGHDSVSLGGGAGSTGPIDGDVDLGADGGSLLLTQQVAADTTLDGGTGPSTLTFTPGSFPGTSPWTVDVGTGDLTVDGAVRLHTTAIHGFYLGQHDVDSFTGTDDDDQLGARDVDQVTALGGNDEVTARSIADGDLGAGNDQLALGGAHVETTGTIDAGPGTRDTLYLTGSRRIDLDLTAGTADPGGDVPPLQLAGFEAYQVHAPTVHAVGTAGPDDLGVYGCHLDVHGDAGADTLVFAPLQPSSETDQPCAARTAAIDGGAGADTIVAFQRTGTVHGGAGADRIQSGGTVYGDAGGDLVVGGAGADRLHGGPGDDVLRGGNGNDELWGDAGTDVANGQAGRDTCHSAETRLSCER